MTTRDSSTWRRTTLTLQAAIIAALMTTFFIAPAGIEPNLIWPIIGLFYIYVICVALRTVTIMPGIESRITIELAFFIFYFLVFIKPYQDHLLGYSDISVNALLSYTFPEQSNAAVILAGIGFTAFHFGVKLVREPSRASVRIAIAGQARGEYRYLALILLVALIALVTMYISLGLTSSDEGRYRDITAGNATGNGIYFVIVVLCMLVTAKMTAVLVNW